MVDHPPDARVVLGDQGGDRPDRHLLAERHHERLEEQRKARALPRPGDAHLAHAVLGAQDARHARAEVGLVLEEVEVAPGLLARVVDRAAGALALRAGEASATAEVEAQVEASARGVEARPDDAPGLVEAERLLEEVEVTHAGLRSSLAESAAR